MVDDVAENRDLLLRRLRRMQLTDTAEAANGREALELIRREPFDLVLLDVMMPEMSGIEVLRALREDGRLTDLPVVMISAASEIEKVVECVELGAEDYLPKPFNPALLAARCARGAGAAASAHGKPPPAGTPDARTRQGPSSPDRHDA